MRFLPTHRRFEHESSPFWENLLSPNLCLRPAIPKQRRIPGNYREFHCVFCAVLKRRLLPFTSGWTRRFPALSETKENTREPNPVFPSAIVIGRNNPKAGKSFFLGKIYHRKSSSIPGPHSRIPSTILPKGSLPNDQTCDVTTPQPQRAVSSQCSGGTRVQGWV